VPRGVLPDRGPGRRAETPPRRKAHLESLIDKYGKMSGVAADRVRRWVSTMVLLGALERVSEQENPRFLLKGGIAMELRLREKARATKDVDVTFLGDPDTVQADLEEALADSYAEFSFELAPLEYIGNTQYQQTTVRLRYRGSSWATLKLEVAPPETDKLEAEPVEAISITDFGLEGPTKVQCLSTRFQIAQKIHAVTERFDHRENDRFRDLIDLLLLQPLVPDLGPVREACVEIFRAREKHAWPPVLEVPDSWATDYAELARKTPFSITDVDEAVAEVQAFIDAIEAAR
jgi:hypothetical protein